MPYSSSKRLHNNDVPAKNKLAIFTNITKSNLHLYKLQLDITDLHLSAVRAMRKKTDAATV